MSKLDEVPDIACESCAESFPSVGWVRCSACRTKPVAKPSEPELSDAESEALWQKKAKETAKKRHKVNLSDDDIGLILWGLRSASVSSGSSPLNRKDIAILSRKLTRLVD